MIEPSRYFEQTAQFQLAKFMKPEKCPKIENSVTVAVNDIYKAFDHVQSNILATDIAKLNRIDLENLNKDYQNLNMAIGNTKLNRTLGVPQGGRVSPLFFNIYMHNAIDNLGINTDFIYADNLVLFTKDWTQTMNKIKNISNNLAERNLKFTQPFTLTAYNKSKLVNSNEQMTKINNINAVTKSTNMQLDLDTTRVLGFQLKVKNGTIDIDESKILSKKYKVPIGPPYKMINYFKQYILPIFRFNMEHKPITYKNYCLYYLKKMMIVQKVPKDFYEANINGMNYWAKFWSLYYARRKELCMPTKQNQNHLWRWNYICKLALKYYIPLYQGIKFVYEGEAKIIKCIMGQKEIIHNLKLLDNLYFMIVHKFNTEKAFEFIANMLLNNKAHKTYNKPSLNNIYL